MEILGLAAAGLVAYFLLRPKASPATADVSTPAPAPATALAVPSPMTFSGASSIVSGGYQTAPYNSNWQGVPPPSNAFTAAVLAGHGGNNPFGPADAASSNVAAAIAATAAGLASTFASPPVPAPPPVQRGGVAGTVGSGGKPLGSALRTGVSSGTGTTVVGTTRLQLLPLTKTLY